MTPEVPWTLADFLGGMVAAEGTFTRAEVPAAEGTTRLTFTFAVALGSTDREMLELLRDALGVGRLRSYARRRAHYDDEVVFAVRAFRDLLDVVVPFMDAHLPPSHKRVQYLAWRSELLTYDELRRNRRRTDQPAASSARQSRVGTSRQRRSRS
jgi:hypothetical protein